MTRRACGQSLLPVDKLCGRSGDLAPKRHTMDVQNKDRSLDYEPRARQELLPGAPRPIVVPDFADFFEGVPQKVLLRKLDKTKHVIHVWRRNSMAVLYWP